jgi:hypothetical protein
MVATTGLHAEAPMPGPGHKSLTPCQRELIPTQSRRDVFRLLTALAVGGSAISFAGLAKAQSKTDKETAKYQDKPNNGQSCSQCNYFHPPKTCQLVEGDVSPSGWCSFFLKKSA